MRPFWRRLSRCGEVWRWFSAPHARATSGWRDTKAAWINIAGFVAMLFNLFIINIVVSGLHSYAGLN